MKKIVFILSVVMVSITLSANAQFYAGGELGFWHNDDADIDSYMFAPEAGYNFNEKWAVGASILLANSEYEDNSKAKGYAFAPYARYYFWSNEKVRLFVDGGIGFSKTEIEYNGYEDKDDDVSGFELGFKPGIAIELNERICFVAKYGFLGTRNDYAIGENGSGLKLSSEDLSIGFHIEF